MDVVACQKSKHGEVSSVYTIEIGRGAVSPRYCAIGNPFCSLSSLRACTLEKPILSRSNECDFPRRLITRGLQWNCLKYGRTGEERHQFRSWTFLVTPRGLQYTLRLVGTTGSG